MNLKKLRAGWPAAAVTFCLGVTLALAATGARSQRGAKDVDRDGMAAPSVPYQTACASATPTEQTPAASAVEDDWPELPEDDKWKAKLNGTKLPLD